MPEKSKKKKRADKKAFLPNNKAFFKGLMPKSEYLSKIRIGEIDIPFMIIILVLLVFGVIMMYSASYAWAIKDNVAPDYYFKHQLGRAVAGLVLMMVIASKRFDYHILRNPAVNLGFFVLCVILMLVVHIP